MVDGEPLRFEDAAAWEAWLAQHYATSAGVQLAIAKSNNSAASLTHADALEVALCYGWIDGVRNRIDQSWFSQSYMPRREGSRWSLLNRERADALIAAGRMRPAGQREIDRAKAQGSWESAYAPQSTMQVPPELEAALAENPRAFDFFETLSGRNRYAVLFRVSSAKQSETRASRAATMVEMLERGETVYPQ
ncbi:YdeI/OmpD-associated family protein [Paramicrobacterium fandaimingii]|uniref:YdeI/OmpD-associated family protein n=1 Tax=Paramicrobacterium fandaimingii TaxID=2708079 RepID=UPI001422650A|nr:YdeI/OmpD-associated family protein [Microbacterium fandaimingii]